MLAVSETRVPAGAPSAISDCMVPTGYQVINVSRPGERKGGGVSFIHRNDLTITQRPVHTTSTTFEVIVIRLIVGNEKFIIANIYRPPGTSITSFFDELSDLFDQMCCEGGHPILVGDFNCPGDGPDRVDSRLSTWTSCYNLVIVNDGPTHLNYDGNMSKLDVIIEPETDRHLNAATTVPVGFSDHNLVTSKLKCTRYKAPTSTYTFRDLRRLDMAAFRDFIRCSASYVSPPADPDELAGLLNSDLKAALDRFAPLHTRTRRTSKPETRWLTKEAREAKQKRRRLERRYSKTKSDVDRRAYRAACRSAHRLITQSLSDHVCDEVKNSAASPRLLWKTVNRLLHPCAGGSWHQDLDTRKLADELRNFFTNKVQNVIQTISTRLSDTHSTPVEVACAKEPISVMSSFTPISPADVEKLITAAPNKTSPIDVIPVSLLKACSAEVSVPIAHLANSSFSTGTFPSIYKVGLVTPLLKKPGLDKSDMKNFRPITNLSTISKILERLVLAQLKSQIVNSPNFCPHQSAYRSAHSTETALIKIVNDVLTSIDKGSAVALVGLDISAAFDTISHQLLLDRLESDFGIRGTTLQWISSYLQHRTFSVRVGQSTSASDSLATSGVPQGSVLGPILFTAYVSPIGRLIDGRGVGYHCYADDTQLYTALSASTSSTSPDLSRLEECTSALQYWFWQHDLLLNPDKSEAIYFGTRQRLCNLTSSLCVAGCSIAATGKLKTLGVTLDSTLSFNSHINNVVSACNFHLRAFRHIRRSLPRDIANTIACSIMGSRVDYCNSLLYNAQNTALQKLQRVQNNFARSVCVVNRRQRPSEDLLYELHWLPVRKRINFKIATLTYRAIQLHQPAYLSSLLSYYRPSRSLRSSNLGLLTKPTSRTAFGARRFASAAPDVWNSLPQNVRSAESIASFKSRLKTHLFTALLP